MKRLKLKHNYHDARIVSVEYRDEFDVAISFTLCGCCNPTPGSSATLIFTGVKNLAEVREALVARVADENESLMECVGLSREDSCYILDLSRATIRINARGLIEA